MNPSISTNQISSRRCSNQNQYNYLNSLGQQIPCRPTTVSRQNMISNTNSRYPQYQHYQTVYGQNVNSLNAFGGYVQSQNFSGPNAYSRNAYGQMAYGRNAYGQNAYGQYGYGQYGFGQKMYTRNRPGQNAYDQYGYTPFGNWQYIPYMENLRLLNNHYRSDYYTSVEPGSSYFRFPGFPQRNHFEINLFPHYFLHEPQGTGYQG